MTKKVKRPYRKTGPKGPTKWTPEAIQKLEEAFEWGCTVVEACLHANMDTSTFYLHAPKGSELFNRFILLKQKPIIRARQTVVEGLHVAESARWYLKNKRSKEFSERTEIDNKITNLDAAKDSLLSKANQALNE